MSLSARSNLEKTIRDILLCVNLKAVFRIENGLSSEFIFKDKISKEIRSVLCYKFQCSSCNAIYYGKTKLCFKVRVSERIGVSARTCKNTMSTKNSAVCDYMLVGNNVVSFEDFSILANRTNDFRIKFQESPVESRYLEQALSRTFCYLELFVWSLQHLQSTSS